MNFLIFNQTMHELVQKLLIAFPESNDIKNALSLLRTLEESSPQTPALLFSENIRPHLAALQNKNYEFMEGPQSPLHVLGLADSWYRMHESTKLAVMNYVIRLAELSVTDMTVSLPPQQQDPATILNSAMQLDPKMVQNLFSIARNATMNMTEDDARSLLEGRDSRKLGDLCFGIIDSLAMQ
jgi:hypothetical protein